ncbi:MAG: hypothetical protein HY303_18930, partial [Candidatus Wallbacteria bacterium]|nr:hypothetical protein [Candidatus Wallbacteria bacterium]
VRHEVSNKTLTEMITEREVVVQSMREQVMSTVHEWGLSVDTIEFAEVWIRSKELFEHLQADYRNQVRLSAQNSTAETNKEIAAKQMESDKSIAMMTAAAEREKRVIATQEEMQASEAELATRRAVKEKEAQVQQHLQLLEKENKHQAQLAELANLQLVKQRESEAKQALELLEKENKHRAQLREQALAHERELQLAQNSIEKQSRQHEVLVDKLAKEEALRLQEAKTAEALAEMAERAKIAQAELERQQEAVKLQALLDEKENDSKQQSIALAAEIKRMRELAEAQLEKARLEAQAILEVGKAESEVLRMKVEAQNAVTPNQLQEQLIAKLPEIARSMKIQDIHWVNMAANGESPMSIVPKNILELLTIFKGFGVDLQGLLGRTGAGDTVPVPPPAVEAGGKN